MSDIIRNAIQEIAGTKYKSFDLETGTVEAVDKTARTCDVKPSDGSATIYDVRLQATPEQTQGILRVPKAGTSICIGWISEEVAIMVEADEYDEIIINNGELGGLTITPELVTQLEKINVFLNAFLGIVNGTPIPEPGSGAASAFQTALRTALSSVQVPNYSEVENNKVKQ